MRQRTKDALWLMAAAALVALIASHAVIVIYVAFAGLALGFVLFGLWMMHGMARVPPPHERAGSQGPARRDAENAEGEG